MRCALGYRSYADMHFGSPPDHGCDPGYKGTDHTRESVPLLGYSKCWKQGVNIGTRDTYADIAATLAQIFEIEYHGDGTGFLEMLK